VCSKERPTIMLLYVRYANLDRPVRPLGPGAVGCGIPTERERFWSVAAAARPACLARLRSTCGHVLQRVESFEPALGTAR
jgi:hypothetical protein